MFSAFPALLEVLPAFAFVSFFSASAGSLIFLPSKISFSMVLTFFRKRGAVIPPRPGCSGRGLRFPDQIFEAVYVHILDPVLHRVDLNAGRLYDVENIQAIRVKRGRFRRGAEGPDGDRGRAFVFSMKGDVVAFLLRRVSGETGVARYVVECAANCAFADGDILLQIVGRFAEQVCVCRYICINRQTY